MRATAIIGADASAGMLRFAAQRAQRSGAEVRLLEADAENLPFGDDSVDYTFSHASYEFWRRRRPTESYPLLSEQVEWLADAAGLEWEAARKCTTPIGVEHTVLFRKR